MLKTVTTDNSAFWKKTLQQIYWKNIFCLHFGELKNNSFNFYWFWAIYKQYDWCFRKFLRVERSLMTYDNNASPNKGIGNKKVNFKLIALMNRINTTEVNQYVCEKTRLNQYSCIDFDYSTLTFTNYTTQGLSWCKWNQNEHQGLSYWCVVYIASI